jgi:acyl-CoA thioesterase-1
MLVVQMCKFMKIGIFALSVWAAGFLTACEPSPREEPGQRRESSLGTIVAMGDSLTAGLGVEEEDAYPAVLERKLQAAGYAFRVVNAGISGETSSGALSRVKWVLKLAPDIVILETGANDGLRGIDPELVRKNIEEMIRIFRQADVTVVLAGMQMVGNLGQTYTAAFKDIYRSMADQDTVFLIPFFLEGVAGKPDMNLQDGIHPNAKGYKRVAENAYPYVVKAIEQTGIPTEESSEGEADGAWDALWLRGQGDIFAKFSNWLLTNLCSECGQANFQPLGKASFGLGCH